MNRAKRAGILVLALGPLALAAGCFWINRPPVASFVVHDNVTEDPLVVDLDASASFDPDDDAIVAYLWTFGEDVEIVTPLDYSKLVTVDVLRVRYPVEGEYSIQLKVRDERGLDSKEAHRETIVLPNLPVTPTP